MIFQIEGERESLKHLIAELFDNRIYFKSFSRIGVILVEPDSHSIDNYKRVIMKYSSLNIKVK